MAIMPIKFIFLSCIFIGICNCFNVEVKSAKIFSGAGGEYFGFTVAFHKAENAYWALVGAPMSNQTGSKTQEKYGAVYRCPISGSSCINMAIDDGTPVSDEIKTGQWMGASLYSMGADQGIIACAPRFMDKTSSGVWLHGRCGFVDGKTFKAGTTFWNPCEFENHGNAAFGYCEAGFSLASASSFVVVGLPGVMQVQGRLAVQSLSNILKGSRGFLPTRGDRLDLGDTMGFSISWGNFSGSKHGDIVGGAPNGSNRKGKVLIYSVQGQLPIFAVIENTDTTMAIGSYFGSVVCAVDLTNDGVSDLVVGAPFYSAVSDEGKVYVYTTSSQSGVTLKGSMLGDRTPGAKFGSSIASAGDLNNDKYCDIVVGAPYGGPDGKGAIYIYHGSANGIGNGYEPVQKIYASTLGGMPATFGFSVAGGMDVDGNGFPDLVIGSFGADKINILKSKSVLKTSATLKTDKAKISLSKNVTSICRTDGAINYQCIEMTFCMTVSGKGISGAIDMDVKFEFDKDQLAGKRAVVDVSSTKQASKQLVITYNANVEKCTKETIYVQTNANNILRPIVIAASYGYKEPSGGCGASPCPIADLYESRVLTTQVTYVKDCGNDDICNADLVVTCKPKFSGGQTSLVFGLEKSFSLQIDATNKGENAFLAKMKVDFPDDLTAVGVEFINEQNPLWERQPTKNGKSSIDFNLDSPFEKNRKLEIVIKFTIAKERPSGKTLEFKIEASSVSSELTPKDNIAIVKVETGLLADITISGSASPDKFFYDKEAIAATSDLKNETQVGPVVEYTFFVQNRGPSPVEGLEAQISLVFKHNKKWVLMLFGATVDGIASCNVGGRLNPLGLNLTNSDALKKSRKRREVKVQEKGTVILNCRTGTCSPITCKLKTLTKRANREIKLRTRLFQNTFIEEKRGPTEIISKASITIPSQELEFLPPRYRNQTILTEVSIHVSPPVSTSLKESEPIAWWIIFLSVLGALLLITGVIIGLWKAGFFNRKRIKDISDPTMEDDMD